MSSACASARCPLGGRRGGQARFSPHNRGRSYSLSGAPCELGAPGHHDNTLTDGPMLGERVSTEVSNVNPWHLWVYLIRFEENPPYIFVEGGSQQLWRRTVLLTIVVYIRTVAVTSPCSYPVIMPVLSAVTEPFPQHDPLLVDPPAHQTSGNIHVSTFPPGIWRM